MCLTLPAKVIWSDNYRAEILAGGQKKIVAKGISDRLEKDDWVLFTSDYLIKKIDEIEAQEIFDLLGSYKPVATDDMAPELRRTLEASAQRDLTVEEIEYLLTITDSAEQEALFSQANVARKANIKDHICIHGIIEFSSYCRNNCLYCGLREENNGIRRYRLEPMEIIEAATRAVEDKGYKILVLQSGEDAWYGEDELIKIITEIKKRTRVFIYLSIGDRSREEYQKLKLAGANGVLYRFETSNSDLYAKLHPGDTLADRLNNLSMMRELGYVISTGPIIGLPGQTIRDLANDILLMKELGTFMPSMGPFRPALGTPMGGAIDIKFDLVLKMIAVSRLVMPKARLPVTTAMETLAQKDGLAIETARQKCFMAGANSVMFNLTPDKYRKDYCIYENKFFDAEKKYEKWGLFKGELSYQMLEDELGLTV
ncbi:MAG: [FeFe] hydrogenase H-cluster radical SAM maturase HydE [Patescibacteria group bacterium]